MIRATTPTHRFNTPFKEADIKSLIISYGQLNKEVLKKTKTDCSFEDTTAIVKLSQEDTKKFTVDTPVKIQMRILTVDGDAVASNIYEISIDEVINDEVL